MVDSLRVNLIVVENNSGAKSAAQRLVVRRYTAMSEFVFSSELWGDDQACSRAFAVGFETGEKGVEGHCGSDAGVVFQAQVDPPRQFYTLREAADKFASPRRLARDSSGLLRSGGDRRVARKKDLVFVQLWRPDSRSGLKDLKTHLCHRQTFFAARPSLSIPAVRPG